MGEYRPVEKPKTQKLSVSRLHLILRGGEEI